MPEILYEDNHLLVVNKRCSEIVQPDRTDDETLLDRLKSHIKTRDSKPGNVFLGVVHRLDRPTSGVVVFAKTSKALARMNALLRAREVRRVYWAVIADLPPEFTATLTHFLVRNRSQNKSYAHGSPVAGSKKGSLSYRVVESCAPYHLLEIDLHTGRHHQIRAQLAAIGCPIEGDLKYGAPRSDPGGGIHLHARLLSFDHPVGGGPLGIVAEPPHDPIWDALQKSRSDRG